MDTKELDSYLRERLKKKHYERTLYVVQLLSSVADKYGLDQRHAILSGLLHLVSRQMEREEMLAYVAQRDKRLTTRLTEADLQVRYLTGPASAWFALEELNERSDDVFRGIRDHTLLYKDPSRLARCLYVATTIAAADQNDQRTAVLLIDFLSGKMDRAIKALKPRDHRSLEKTGVYRLARLSNPDFRDPK